MTRAVLDSNVLVSAFPDREGLPWRLIELWQAGTFELIVSEHILAGVLRAWDKEYFRPRIAAGPAADAILLLRTLAEVVVPGADVRGIADDDEDDLVLATAVAGQADYLATGDNGLLRLGTFRDIQIISPRDFLSFLEARQRVDPT